MNEHNPLTPIQNEDDLQGALRYIAEESLGLAREIVGEKLSLDALTVFAQSDVEYQLVRDLISDKGEVSPYTHESTLYIKANTIILDQEIQLLGVRRPDKGKPQRGYGDYPVYALHTYKEKLANNKHVQEIKSGNGLSLLELSHPDFNVLGYIVEVDDD